MSQTFNLDMLKEIPGYKVILRALIKTQIQLLIEQLSDQTGEESVVLTASISDGTLMYLGSQMARGFYDGRDEVKAQFLGYCMRKHQRSSSIQSGSGHPCRDGKEMHKTEGPPAKKQKLYSFMGVKESQCNVGHGISRKCPKFSRTGQGHVNSESHSSCKGPSPFQGASIWTPSLERKQADEGFPRHTSTPMTTKYSAKNTENNVCYLSDVLSKDRSKDSVSDIKDSKVISDYVTVLNTNMDKKVKDQSVEVVDVTGPSHLSDHLHTHPSHPGQTAELRSSEVTSVSSTVSGQVSDETIQSTEGQAQSSPSVGNFSLFQSSASCHTSKHQSTKVGQIQSMSSSCHVCQTDLSSPLSEMNRAADGTVNKDDGKNLTAAAKTCGSYVTDSSMASNTHDFETTYIDNNSFVSAADTYISLSSDTDINKGHDSVFAVPVCTTIRVDAFSGTSSFAMKDTSIATSDIVDCVDPYTITNQVQDTNAHASTETCVPACSSADLKTVSRTGFEVVTETITSASEAKINKEAVSPAICCKLADKLTGSDIPITFGVSDSSEMTSGVASSLSLTTKGDNDKTALKINSKNSHTGADNHASFDTGNVVNTCSNDTSTTFDTATVKDHNQPVVTELDTVEKIDTSSFTENTHKPDGTNKFDVAHLDTLKATENIDTEVTKYFASVFDDSVVTSINSYESNVDGDCTTLLADGINDAPVYIIDKTGSITRYIKNEPQNGKNLETVKPPKFKLLKTRENEPDKSMEVHEELTKSLIADFEETDKQDELEILKTGGSENYKIEMTTVLSESMADVKCEPAEENAIVVEIIESAVDDQIGDTPMYKGPDLFMNNESRNQQVPLKPKAMKRPRGRPKKKKYGVEENASDKNQHVLVHRKIHKDPLPLNISSSYSEETDCRKVSRKSKKYSKKSGKGTKSPTKSLPDEDSTDSPKVYRIALLGNKSNTSDSKSYQNFKPRKVSKELVYEELYKESISSRGTKTSESDNNDPDSKPRKVSKESVFKELYKESVVSMGMKTFGEDFVSKYPDFSEACKKDTVLSKTHHAGQESVSNDTHLKEGTSDMANGSSCPGRGICCSPEWGKTKTDNAAATSNELTQVKEVSQVDSTCLHELSSDLQEHSLVKGHIAKLSTRKKFPIPARKKVMPKFCNCSTSEIRKLSLKNKNTSTLVDSTDMADGINLTENSIAKKHSSYRHEGDSRSKKLSAVQVAEKLPLNLEQTSEEKLLKLSDIPLTGSSRVKETAGKRNYLKEAMEGGKLFCCDVCGKKFSFKSHLENHRIIHTDNKPFQCRVCSRHFRLKHQIQRHIELVHIYDRSGGARNSVTFKQNKIRR